MANEDVLEELYYWVGRIERNEPGASEYIETLAAALREAREKLSAFEKVGKAAGKVLHDGLQREAAAIAGISKPFPRIRAQAV